MGNPIVIIEQAEIEVANALSRLSNCNPFTTERIELEKEILGDQFDWNDSAWHKRWDIEGVPPNVEKMTDVAKDWAERIRNRMLSGAESTKDERHIYRDIVYYYVYNAYQESFHLLLEEEGKPNARYHAPFYKAFRDQLEYYFAEATPKMWTLVDPVHLFACYYQLRRAFHYIYGNILGGSASSARLRTSVWESIFTHDMGRYRRSLYKQMTDISTLIIGPSGTGKELVAQAIGYSRYIPFDEGSLRFDEDYRASFYPVNLSALSQTLIESELFGHKKGSFTGASGDRIGWFGRCTERGTVFLDEIGDTNGDIQVKLLRVLQSRVYQPVGDVEPATFHGKVIAATNRDLQQEIEEGNFREDLYYRLRSDLIETPGLAAQIAEEPKQLHQFVQYISRKVAGEKEADALAAESEAYIEKQLGKDYPWPGNVRELEQCVRNIMIRKTYVPAQRRGDASGETLGDQVMAGTLKFDELFSRYASLVYAQTGNYEETGRRLGLDGRTVKTKVNHDYVNEYKG
jgi:transcriptional regulator with AAA-type ATPase domain